MATAPPGGPDMDLGLDDAQWRVVEWGGPEPLVVAAGPGADKPRGLAARIAHCVRDCMLTLTDCDGCEAPIADPNSRLSKSRVYQSQSREECTPEDARETQYSRREPTQVTQ